MRGKDTHYRLVLFERLAKEFGECNENNPEWQPGRTPRDRAHFESIIKRFADIYGGTVDTMLKQVEAATSPLRTAHGDGPSSQLMQTKIDAYRAGMIDCWLAFGTRTGVRGNSTARIDTVLPRRGGQVNRTSAHRQS